MKKKNKNILLVAAILVAALLIFVAVARLVTPEDTWLCVNGEWVKHGQPDAAKPTSGCGENTVNKNVNAINSNINSNTNQNANVAIGSFDECAAAGNPVQESYPRKCTVSGLTFTENIGNELEKKDVIALDSPRPNQEISSPLAVSGRAKGTWYFEGVIGLQVTDANEKNLGQAQAQAEGEWMTEEFVNFKANLTFSQSPTATGYFIVYKANPSGLPEKDDQLKIPVKFSQ